MAETPGVTPSGGGGGSAGSNAPPARGSFIKKNKALVFGGGGLALFLMMSHKGSSSQGGSNDHTSPQDQLQAQSDAIAAQESAALQSGALLPGGTSPVDTGGGSYTYQGPSATTAPAVTVNQPPATINVNNPPPASAPAAPGQPKPSRPPAPRLPKGWQRAPFGHTKPTPPKGYAAVGQGSGYWAFKPVNAPKPKAAHKQKPAPAHKRGGHPNTKHKTSHGHRRSSPPEVEAMAGFGAGIMVMGREFPGALSHRMGPPKRHADGSISRKVTVDYGARTESHEVHGDGHHWTDNLRGANPPSRGVEMVTNGAPQ